MELWRRIILCIFVFASIGFAKLALLSPFVLVRPVDFEKKQSKEGSYMGIRIMSDEKRKLIEMPLNEYIHEVTKGRLYGVEGKTWEAVFQTMADLRNEKAVGREWLNRLPSEQHAFTALFFKPDETPVNLFKNDFQKNHDTVYVSLTKENKTNYLELEHRRYSDDDFHFGRGFSNYPAPPTGMLFPFRKYSPWIALIGVLMYMVLPLRKLRPGAFRYPRWRIILGDFACMLFIVPFFYFPFLIVGGSLQVFTVGWPFLIFFWPILFLGLWGLTVSAWFAAFSLRVAEDRLELSSYKGEQVFFFRDMEFFQPVIFKPPKWLMILSFIAALSAKGSSKIGAIGRAMILSGAAYGSLGIRLKNGSDLYINVTDMMGTEVLKESLRIVQALREAEVEEKKEVRQIRSLGLETLRLPKAT